MWNVSNTKQPMHLQRITRWKTWAIPRFICRRLHLFHRDTEIAFEQKLRSLTSVDFMGEVSHFIGITFAWEWKPDNHIAVHMTQEAFSDNLIEEVGLTDANPVKTLCRSGHPVDNIPSENHPSLVQSRIKHTMQSLVGSLLWLSGAMRPDLTTIVSLLGQHTHQGHINAVKYVIRYLKVTKNRGISFSVNRTYLWQHSSNFL